MLLELALAVALQDPAKDLKHAAELMDRSTEYLHKASRPPKAEDGRKGAPSGSLDLSIERQKAAMEILDELLKQVGGKPS